jgi:hypothetical protein
MSKRHIIMAAGIQDCRRAQAGSRVVFSCSSVCRLLACLPVCLPAYLLACPPLRRAPRSG